MRVFKFVPEAFAQDFAKGIVRISPASDFRRQDGVSGAQNDLSELTTIAKIQDGEEVISSAHPAFKDFLQFYRNGIRQEIEFVVSGESVTTFGNALLFCASAAFDCEMRSRMIAEFGASAVFEVSDINEFAKVLSAHHYLENLTCQHQSIQYSEHASSSPSVQESKPVNPFVKGPSFAWQREYRIVWEGETNFEPFNVSDARLSPLIRRVA